MPLSLPIAPKVVVMIRSTESPPFPGLWLVDKLPYICRQTADSIERKFGGQTHYGTPHIWLNFGYIPLNFQRFLACLHAFADKRLIRVISNLAGELHQGWWEGFTRTDKLLVTLCWIPGLNFSEFSPLWLTTPTHSHHHHHPPPPPSATSVVTMKDKSCLTSSRKSFNYLCHISVEIWLKMKNVLFWFPHSNYWYKFNSSRTSSRVARICVSELGHRGFR